MADDELDALLQLAEEADGAAASTAHATATAATPAAADDDDPLLGLADAICPTDQTNTIKAPAISQHEPVATSRPSLKPALCSTKAFSAATRGSSSFHTNNSSSRPATVGPGTFSSGGTSAGRPRQPQEVQHYVEKLTGLKIKLPRVSGVVLKERYRHVTCVPVSKAQ